VEVKMPDYPNTTTMVIPGILQGIGEGIYRRKAQARKDKEDIERIKNENTKRHIEYIMQKIEDPNVSFSDKNIYRDQYYSLTGLRLYPSQEELNAPAEIYKPPIKPEPTTEYFNKLAMTQPELLGKMKTTEAQGRAYEAMIPQRQTAAQANIALADQRRSKAELNKSIKLAKDKGDTKSEISALRTKLQATGQELMAFKEQFGGGYINDPYVQQLIQERQSDLQRLDELTGKQAGEEIKTFDETMERLNIKLDRLFE
jgi:hypothetical protein